MLYAAATYGSSALGSLTGTSVTQTTIRSGKPAVMLTTRTRAAVLSSIQREDIVLGGHKRKRRQSITNVKTFIATTVDFIKVERTRLAADATAGSDVTLTLESTDGLSNVDYIFIGHEGGELAELEQINQAVSGSTSVRVATLKFNHQKGEPVTRYRYNKRKFYGATTAGGSYTELTDDGSPKDIQVDEPPRTEDHGQLASRARRARVASFRTHTGC
jgi:hypothetical protein